MKSTFTICFFAFWDESAHNEIRDFYGHMTRTHERLISPPQAAFVVMLEISHSDISGIIKKINKTIFSLNW